MSELRRVDLDFKSKKEVIEMAEADAVMLMEAAEESVLMEYITAKKMIQYWTTFSNGIHEEALEEYEQTGEKTYETRNVKISKSEYGTKYDYSGCGSEKILELQKQQKELAQKIKDEEKILNSITSSFTSLNEESGEVVLLRPPVKTSTTKIKLEY